MPDSLSAYQWFAKILRDETLSYAELDSTTVEDDLWQVGIDNGILALASHKLSNSPTKFSIPPSLKERLHKYTLNAVANELGQEHELRNALSILTKANLPFLLMKGTPLAYTHYAQSYLRTRCDTDILFASREDAENAWQLLKSNGYERPNAVSGTFVSHEFSCYKKAKINTGLALDMHWKLSNAQRFACSLDFDELQPSATEVAALGEKVLALGPLHALLLACMHRIAHKPEKMENRLIWLYDIHLLASQFTNLQWQAFVTLTKEKALCGICLDGIKQTMKTFSSPVPEKTIQQLAAGSGKEKYSSEIGDSRLSMEMANLRALPGWKERAGLIKERVFPDSDYMLKKYGTRHKLLLPYLYLKRAMGGALKIMR